MDSPFGDPWWDVLSEMQFGYPLSGILENTNLASQEQELVDPPGRVKSQGGPESPS